MASARAFLACLVSALLVGAGATPQICAPAPDWPGGPTPGNVTLVWLLKASWQQCLRQASRLESLLQALHQSGGVDVQARIVNSDSTDDRDSLPQLLDRVLIPVIQDSSNLSIWQRMEGSSLDMFLYDRCGRLTHFIPFPLSLIHPRQQVVRQSIVVASRANVCGTDCSFTSPWQRNDSLSEEIEEAIDANEVVEDVEIQLETVANQTSPNDLPIVEDFEDLEVDEPSGRGSGEISRESSLRNVLTFLWKDLFPRSREEGNEIEPTSPKSPPGQDPCRGRGKNMCKKWPASYLEKARRCCARGAEEEGADKEECQRFTPRKCSRLESTIACCTTCSDDAQHPVRHNHNLDERPRRQDDRRI